MPSTRSVDYRAGAAVIAPMLVGVVPFGLVAGATTSGEGLGAGTAIGMSLLMFAGASQLAAADVLIDGGSAVVAALAACTINLRMLLYSASLAPYLTGERLSRRFVAAYLMTDQAYAVSIARWSDDSSPEAEPRRRMPYYLGAALLLWLVWQVATVVGVLIGPVIPEGLPLDFAVALVFLVLLVPTLVSRPAVAAALAGGGGAVLAGELGAGSLAVIVGAVSGITGGVLAELTQERRRGRRPEGSRR